MLVLIVLYKSKPIFFPNFLQGGIHKVLDIWNCETNNFKNSNFNSLIDKRNWISQWTRLKKAITDVLKNSGGTSLEKISTI
jgi:hypothetical protein